MKFTQSGEIRVTATHSHGVLRVAVMDTGVGIRPEALAGLFEKFSQVDASTTRRFGGTGLGLAICQQLAMLMGGAVEAESEVGRGSTFTLAVPVARLGDEQQPRPVPEPDTTVGRRYLTFKVMAAEDNEVNQLVLKTLLAQIGIEPLVVGDGEEAVAAWEAGDWDAILMDVQMPVMDGVSATRLIRLREAETGRRRTPIIALTANAMAHHIADYLAAGMDSHVAKPIAAVQLFEALQVAVDHALSEGEPVATTSRSARQLSH